MNPPCGLNSLTNSVLGKTPEAEAFWRLIWRFDEACSEALRNGFSPLYALDDQEVLKAWPNPHRQGNISREQGRIGSIYAGLKMYKPVRGNGMKLKDRIWKAVSYFEVKELGGRSSVQLKAGVTLEQILEVLVRLESKIGKIEQQLGRDGAVA